MRLTVPTLAVALALTAAPAAAQTPRFTASFDLGGGVPLTGDLHGAGVGTVLDLPTTVDARSYDDIYGGAPLTWNAAFGVWAGANTEVRARVFRTSVEATELQVGDVAALPLLAAFDSYDATGMDVGVRQYYGSTIRPYVGGSVGFVRTDEINSTFSVPAANVVLPNVPMLGTSTAPTFALSAGIFVPMTTYFGVQSGVDLRWIGDLDPVDGLAGTGLESINDETRRWSMPITVGAVVQF